MIKTDDDDAGSDPFGEADSIYKPASSSSSADAVNIKSSVSKEEKSMQQVAIAHSSIRRLQMVVKEKEDIIVTLQNAVSEAYQAALQEQAHDQAQLEALHAVLNAHAGQRNSVALHQALQALSRQGSDARSSGVTAALIKATARLVDDHLQQLISTHEHEMQALHKSLDFYKDQCKKLETHLAEERLQHQLHINNIAEEVRKQNPEEEQQWHNEIEKYQNQLKSKGAKLKEMREEMRLMELLVMNAQHKSAVRKDAFAVNTSEYAKMRTQLSHLQSQVIGLFEQLRQAKQTSKEAQLVDHVNSQAVKLLQEETTRGKEVVHKLAVQLAQCRQKERQSEAVLPTSRIQSLAWHNRPPHDIDPNAIQEKRVQTMPHIHDFKEDFVEGNNSKALQELSTRKIHNLQKMLKKCRDDLKESEESRLLFQKMTQEFKTEVHRYRQSIFENKQKLLEQRKQQGSSADCVKIKQLLETLEQVESENTKLRNIVMVGQQSTICKLKKEVIELKNFCFNMGKDDAECSIHEYNLPTMENTIPDKENEILQLKFDHEQALWKLSQLKQPPHAFAGKKLLIRDPNALSLMRTFIGKVLKIGSLPREKELECLVEGLLRVVEKKRVEVEHLQQACHDTIQHIERSKQLQQHMDELQGKLWNNDECCQIHYNTIEGLKNDLEKLTQANAKLMHILKETEISHMELQEKLHEATKAKFSPRKRCSFNEDEQHEISNIDVQAQEISKLQKELGAKSQTISDLKSQLETRDDELDFLHGQLAIKEALENDYSKQMATKQYLSNDIDIEEDGAKENTHINLTSLEDLRTTNQELVKVCVQYEELLERQSEQLGIPFQHLRDNLRD